MVPSVQIKLLSGNDGVDRCRYLHFRGNMIVDYIISLCTDIQENVLSLIPQNCPSVVCLANPLTGTEKRLWDAVLHNVKVVVSTYQILLDALTHAFVHMESLALIVFDEGKWPSPSLFSTYTLARAKLHKPTTVLAEIPASR